MKHGLISLLLLLCACQPVENKTRKGLVARLRDARPASRIVALRELAHDPNREETAAVASSAQNATEDVRVEIAATLGASKHPQAVDFLGVLLRDSADSVRAAAVKALEGKGGERAAAYVAHAYEGGGPRTRAAIAEGAQEIFRRGVEGEAQAWRSRLARKTKDSRREVQADARSESGRDATAETITRLTAQLADPDPVLASAAAAGLVNARATDAIPALTKALRSPSPLVVQASALALSSLGAQPALNDLVVQIESARDDTASELMDAIEDLTLDDSAKQVLCRVAIGHPEGSIALRAARLVGNGCTLPATLPAAPAEAAPRLLVLAALERKDATILKSARVLLDDPSAVVGTAAATYLARCGDKSDGPALVAHAQSQLAGLGRARADKVARSDARNSDKTTAEQQMQMLRAFLRQYGAQDLANGPPEVTNRLARLLEKRRSFDDLSTAVDRPGALAYLQAVTAAAAKLGGPIDELVAALLVDKDRSVRGIVADVANVMAGDREPLLAKLRTDADPNLQLNALLMDHAAGRAGTDEALAGLLSKLDPENRQRVALAMNPEVAEDKALLLALLSGNDAVAPIAARVLSRVTGADVDEALIRVVSREGPASVAGLVALQDRPGPAVDAALQAAAVHPSPDVRGFAVQSLVKRKACGSAARLAPLAADYDGSVRTGLDALQKVCGTH